MKKALIIIAILSTSVCFSQGNSTKVLQDSATIKKTQADSIVKRNSFLRDSIDKAITVEYITEKDMEDALQYLEDNISVTEYKRSANAILGFREIIKQSALARKRKTKTKN